MPNEGLPSFDMDVRQRRVSERSDAFSETDSHTQLPSLILRRKRFLRSQTDAGGAAAFLNMEQPLEDDNLKNSETITSRENLTRNDSSVSIVDPQNVQEDVKTTTTTSQDSEVSKDVAAAAAGVEVESMTTTTATRRKEVVSLEREVSSEAPASEPLRQDSTERPIRQNGRTRSESDDVVVMIPPPNIQRGVTWAEPRVAVIPSSVTSAGSTQRSILLAMRAEYTSITDELESYCGLLSPPRTPPVSPPLSRSRNVSEINNPEMAWQIENEHLRDAEECDYQQMEDLIQRRYKGDDEDESSNPPEMVDDGATNANNNFFAISNEQHRQLRRSSAIDEDSRRPPPTISVTREIEQTLSSRPPNAIRDPESPDPSDKNMSTVPAPASETMC